MDGLNDLDQSLEPRDQAENVIGARHGLFVERPFNGRRFPRCIPDFPKRFERSAAVEWLEHWNELHLHKSVRFTPKNLRLSLQAAPIWKLKALDL